MKRLTLAAASLGVGALLSVVGLTAAHADASQSYYLSGIERSNISYVSSTNIIRAYDAYADGYGARGYWRTNYGHGGSIYNQNGAGTQTSTTVSASSGTIIYIRACAADNGVDVGCRTTEVSTTL